MSALVHSSTLVTAGVYLLLRHNYIILGGGGARVVLGVGLITMLMAGAAALFELDIKKIVALSTLSQLGVIFFSLGLGLPFLAFFHLVSHAYFKAVLFMAAGAIIHSVKDYQDLRKVGRSALNKPLLGSVILTANLSLCGMPFLSGFYSKDLILEIMMIGGQGLFLCAVSVFATVLTVVYSCRLTLLLFRAHTRREPFRLEGDANPTMSIRMLILILPAITEGFFLTNIIPSATLIFLGLVQKIIIILFILRSAAFTLLLFDFKFQPGGRFLNLAHEI